MKKNLAMLLAAGMAVTSLAGCQKTEEPAAQTTAATAQTLSLIHIYLEMMVAGQIIEIR